MSNAAPTSLALRRIFAGVLLAVGSLSLCCGLFSGLFFPWAFNSDVALVVRQEPLSYVALEDGTPGRPALIEGRLSPRNRTSPEGFVLYIRSVPAVNDKGERSWREVERVYPPLLVELPGGEARVVGDYRLNGSTEREESAAQLLEGLRPGAEVIVVGTLVQGQEAIELEAELLGVGTRASFIAENRAAARFFGIFGWLLVGGGVLMLGVGLFLLLRLLRPQQP